MRNVLISYRFSLGTSWKKGCISSWRHDILSRGIFVSSIKTTLSEYHISCVGRLMNSDLQWRYMQAVVTLFMVPPQDKPQISLSRLRVRTAPPTLGLGRLPVNDGVTVQSRTCFNRRWIVAVTLSAREGSYVTTEWQMSTFHMTLHDSREKLATWSSDASEIPKCSENSRQLLTEPQDL
jgi:hypothetical protein